MLDARAHRNVERLQGFLADRAGGIETVPQLETLDCFDDVGVIGVARFLLERQIVGDGETAAQQSDVGTACTGSEVYG